MFSSLLRNKENVNRFPSSCDIYGVKLAKEKRLKRVCRLESLVNFILLPVFHGCDSLCPVEYLGKVAQGGKTQQLRDLGHG